MKNLVPKMNERSHWKAAKKYGSANPANFAMQKYKNFFFRRVGGAVPETLTRFYDDDKTAAQSGLGLISA